MPARTGYGPSPFGDEQRMSKTNLVEQVANAVGSQATKKEYAGFGALVVPWTYRNA